MKLFEKLFSGKEISGRSWVVSTLIGVGLVLLFLGCMNFFIDPFAYFRFSDGKFSEFQDGEDSYLRYIKAKQIQYDGDKYDAFIIGGSKAGAINPEVAGELDGHTYYNSWILSGNTHEYLLYTQFILEHTDATKILLHLSGPEIRKADRSTLGDLYKTPAVITDGDEVAEFVEYLGKNVSFAWEDMTEMISGDYSISNPGFENGMRNVNYRYAKLKKDPEGYISTAVLHDYDTNLKKLFTVTPKNKAINESLDDLKQIKKLCDDNGIELQVVIGASFINELYEYEAKTYWSYLLQVIDIFGEVWDFSGFNDVCLNPYNFYNESHYNYEVGDLMLRTMAKGEQIVDGFGILVNPDNRFDWLKARRASYLEFKAEYLETGTVDISKYTSYEGRVQ